MVLLRRVIGDALRARRQGQHRTLREVSTAANVSLGYLSEIERGQKEASSELLAAICEALGAQLSEVLREVSDTLALDEQMKDVLVPPVQQTRSAAAGRRAEQRTAVRTVTAEPAVRRVATDGNVQVSVRQETPLKATLRTRKVRPGDRDRDVVYAA
jgi:transcriptional regulator with XRE-family HTH domain